MKIKLLVEMRILPFEVIETSEAWAAELIADGHAVLVEEELRTTSIDQRERKATPCTTPVRTVVGRKPRSQPSSL
jgi:hypothetical protein